MIVRRSFLKGFAAFMAAPAIVHVGNLMPIKSMPIKSMLEVTEYELAGMSASTIFYGNAEWLPIRFTGFAARYSLE